MKAFISLKTFTLLALLLGLSNLVASEQKNLSFVEFLQLAQENDPNLSLILADRERVKFLADLELPASQLLLQAQSEYGVGVTVDTNTNRNSATLTKNFRSSGTSVRVGYTNDDLATGTSEVTEFSLEQALFKNLFGKYTRLQESAIKKEAASLAMQVVDTYESYLRDLGTLYLDYAQAWHNVDLAKRILNETIGLRDNVVKMRKNNIASTTDVDRANLQVSLAKEDLVQLQSRLGELAAQLKTSANIKDATILPDLESFNELLPRVSLEGIKYEELRVAKIAEYERSAAEKRLKLADTLNSPSLNLVAGYNIDKSSRFGTLVNREERVLGLQLEMPFGNSRNNALLKEASLERTKSEIRQYGQRRASMQNFEITKLQLERAKEVLDINQSKVSLSEKVYQGDLQRYQYGKMTLDRLIETKNTYSRHRYELFTSSASYFKRALNWLDLSDRLVQKI